MAVYNYDNIHYSLNRLLSYNKKFNYVVSCRGSGKTTDITRYMYKLHKKGKMVVVIRRQIVDCSETYIKDLENNINRWLDEDKRIKFKYKKGDITQGILDVYIEGEEQPFFRLIALSNPIYRLKGQCFLENNLSLIFFDEYKISAKEKYLEGEYTSKFKELYTTLQRFGDNLRTIFAGNNYSSTDPYVAGMHIPVNKIKPGTILVGDNWAFEDYVICDELRKQILANNPLFSFGEDAYTKYALEGKYVEDERIRLVDKQPSGFGLRYVFYLEGQKLGIFFNRNDIYKSDVDCLFWVSVLEDYESKNRNYICLDISDLIENTFLLDKEDKKIFFILRKAFTRRLITFKTVNEAYLFELVYENL